MKIYYLNTRELSEEKIRIALDECEEYRRNRFFSSQNDLIKRENIGSDILIKLACADFFGLGTHVKTEYDSNGKIIFSNRKEYISLSHTCGHCFFAISNAPVGIDGEFIREIDYMGIAKRFFGENALFEMYSEYDEDLKRKTFFRKWTEYEALFKLQGSKKTYNPKHLTEIPIRSFDYEGMVITVAGKEVEKLDLKSDFKIMEII